MDNYFTISLASRIGDLMINSESISHFTIWNTDVIVAVHCVSKDFDITNIYIRIEYVLLIDSIWHQMVPI